MLLVDLQEAKESDFKLMEKHFERILKRYKKKRKERVLVVRQVK